MAASDQNDQEVFWHMYGMALWNFYLDQHVGGHELVMDVWDYTNDHGRYYNISQRDALEGLGYDFDELYKGFISTNTAMDYHDGNRIPRLTVHDTVTDLPADGGSVNRSAPESYGQNYIEFDLDPRNPKDLVVSFEGDAGGDWLVMMVGVVDGQVAHTQRLKTPSGSGSVRVLEYTAYDEAWMVVSPRAPGNRGFSYDWEASQEGATGPAEFSELPGLASELEEPADPSGAEDGASARDLAGEPGGPAGCGCGGVTPASWWGLAVLPVALLRRRRPVM